MLLLPLACVLAVIGPGARAQSGATFSMTQPQSTTPEMLVGDPSNAGRASLLAALGNPPEYFAQYPYPWPEGQYNIDPRIDPAVVTPIPGNQSPGNGTFTVVGNSGMISVHAIPFPNGEYLFFGRPNEDYGGGDPAGPGVHWLTVDGGNHSEIAAIYDSKTNTFEPFHIPEAPFCGAQTLLPDGRAIVVGGEHINLYYPFLQYGLVAIRIYDPNTHTIKTVNTMDRGRWYPSIMVLPDGNILVVGGAQQEIGGWSVSDAASSPTANFESQMLMGKCVANGGAGNADPYWDNPSYFIYNVSDNTMSPSLTLTILLAAYPINLYPVLTVLPTGSTLIIAGIQVAALFMMPEGAFPDEAVGPLPNLPLPVGATQYTPVAMLTLSPPNYDAQFLVAGGSSDFCPNNSSPANDQSYLIDVTPGADHSIVTEQLAFRRVMGDLTLLPDGRLFLSNGAQVGLGGGGGPRFSYMKDPTTITEMYDPTRPVGQRWSRVGDSQIPRLYHSVAWLTPDATIAISGSETTAERRVQIYRPDYFFSGKPRPVITAAPPTVGYNASFEVSFSNVSAVDRVVLMRPSPATHGVHFDQRSVQLDCQAATRTLTCTSPPSSFVAPPGTYMLFILAQGVPSVAVYIAVPEPESFYQAADANAPLAGTQLQGGITGPASAPLYAEGPESPSVFNNAPVLGTGGYAPGQMPTDPSDPDPSQSATVAATTAGR